MKCIHCQHDAKYRERSNGCCPQCQRRFAFEPKQGDPMTDGVFAAAIERVSSRGSVRFLPDHLYYEIRRRYRRASFKLLRNGAIFAAVMLIAGLSFGMSPPVLVVIVALYGSWLWAQTASSERRRFPRAKFDALLQRFIVAHGTPRGLIERLERAPPTPVERDPGLEEMSAYSFDRAVICDRPETVDMLLANRFHFENNCAVLAIGGYPPRAFKVVRDMLRNNPRLVVVALHDASEAGCKLAYQLRNQQSWFKDLVPVIDVGLRPVHSKSLQGQEDRRPRRGVLASEGISGEEAAWLAHSSLSLAVVVPEQVIKRLFRAISVVEEQQDSGTSGSGSDGSSSLDTDADLADGGGDSFG